MKNVIIILLVAIILLLGVGGYFLFAKSGNSAYAESEPETPKYPAETVELPEFIVNLADKGRPHYLKATIVIEVRGPESHEKVKHFGPYIRDRMLSTLSKQNYQDLLTQQGKDQLRTELLHCTQQVLNRDEDSELEVSDILFTSFVMD